MQEFVVVPERRPCRLRLPFEYELQSVSEFESESEFEFEFEFEFWSHPFCAKAFKFIFMVIEGFFAAGGVSLAFSFCFDFFGVALLDCFFSLSLSFLDCFCFEALCSCCCCCFFFGVACFLALPFFLLDLLFFAGVAYFCTQSDSDSVQVAFELELRSSWGCVRVGLKEMLRSLQRANG